MAPPSKTILGTQASGRRIRILFLDHTALLSGGELALYSMVEQIDRARYEPIVLLCQNGPLEDKMRAIAETHMLPLDDSVRNVRKDSIGWHTLLNLPKLMVTLLYIFRLRKFIRELHPDIIHTNSLKADILGGFAVPMLGIPLIWHIRDRIDANYLPLKVVHAFRYLSRIIPDRIICNSKATLETLQMRDEGRSEVIPSGFDVGYFRDRSADSERLSTALALQHTVRIGIIGRISPWKGQDIFLQAARLVREQYTDVRFYLIGAPLFGEESYELKLRSLAEELQLQDVVTFTGFQEDVASAIADLHLVVHASTIPEPFGQVIAQGMAAGKPVVATRGGGASEIVTHEVNGILVTPSDPEDMARAIISLLQDPVHAEQLAREGQRGSVKAFSGAGIARRIEAVYEDLLGARNKLTGSDFSNPSPRRFRILHYNTTASVSGAEVVLLNILRGIDGAKLESILVCPHGPLSRMAEDLGVKVINLGELHARFTRNILKMPGFCLSILSTALHLRLVVRNLRPNIIHANSIRAGIVSTIATIGMKVPIEWHLHDTLPSHPISPFIRALAACSRRSCIIAVSSATLSAFCGTFWRKRLLKIGSVLLNGIDVSRYQPRDGVREQMRAELGIRDDEFCIAHVGQVIPRKDQQGMVEAFLFVQATLPTSVLLMVGTPVFESGRLYSEKVKKTVSNLHLQDSVRLLGFRKDIPEIMQACDLLVMNSLADPCPLTVLEAMAMETPVLASNVDGIPELVTNNITGWLFVPNAPSYLAIRILEIARMTHEERRAVGRNARQVMIDQHSLPLYVEGFVDISLMNAQRFNPGVPEPPSRSQEQMPLVSASGSGQ